MDLLAKVTDYKGIESDGEWAGWFWEVLHEFSQWERQLFLRFVWGRTRLPRNIADFRGRDFVVQVITYVLQSKLNKFHHYYFNFKVMDKYQPPDSYLPEAYTCFFLLKLPRYSSKAVLKSKLTYAIHFCKSIDIDEYAHIGKPYERVHLDPGCRLRNTIFLP